LFWCKEDIIEPYDCLYAITALLRIFVACVQIRFYRTPTLLMCRHFSIERANCLCASHVLLKFLIACVHYKDYWIYGLLVCNIRGSLLHFTCSGI